MQEEVKSIGIDEVRDYFSSKSYSLEQISQPWRHIVGVINKNGQTFFFKVARDQQVGERTQNEVDWNNYINSTFENSSSLFRVPNIYETGFIGESFYYIGEYFQHPFIAEGNIINIEAFISNLDKIIATNLFLFTLPLRKFQRDKEYENRDDIPALFAHRAEKWVGEILQSHKYDIDLSQVLNIASELPSTYIAAINHGDFTPRHIMTTGSNIILIDGEHASSKRPKFYDVIYLYHRVYTAMQNPLLAKRYLSAVKNALSPSEEDYFLKAIRPIIAIRLIGGIRDNMLTDESDIRYHADLLKDIVNNELI